MAQKSYLSTREAADLLGVAVSTVQLWSNNGLLHAWKTGGGHRRIARGSVEAMLARQRGVLARVERETRPSVVIVEDDEQQLRMYRQQFTHRDIAVNVITAQDGYEGLIKIGLHQPDVIITDLIMPNINGFQMIRLIRDMPELMHSLVLVVSGLDETEVQRRGGLPDGVHLFTKPVEFEKLEARMQAKLRVNVA